MVWAFGKSMLCPVAKQGQVVNLEKLMNLLVNPARHIKSCAQRGGQQWLNAFTNGPIVPRLFTLNLKSATCEI